MEISANSFVVLSGRIGLDDVEDADNVAFPCVATVPARVVVSTTNRKLVEQMRIDNITVLEHQHTPLRMTQRWAGLQDQALFDTIFVYQPGAEEEDEMWKKLKFETASVDVRKLFELCVP